MNLKFQKNLSKRWPVLSMFSSIIFRASVRKISVFTPKTGFLKDFGKITNLGICSRAIRESAGGSEGIPKLNSTAEKRDKGRRTRRLVMFVR